ncbi:hypothetical protein GA0074695_0960 [Micromonospora viridifaciens]|uniref:Uncharacterized protein n=1 Tax=Micromonospora viridifaciens TaxID=1881 RepID=A0A1C4UZ77_MICVI|nr:hypothetical protein [Micromonospora viridifaciens]SCE76946.1 hypothetical protein GA0074695_0960 [Micromonospora viridifaciens]
MSRERFVVHLPVLATDLEGARRFARSICRALGFLADVDRNGTTVSAEDAQCVRHWVYCDRLLDGGRRCPRSADHDGACGQGG